MTGSARVFVDTNVLVYARDGSERVKQPHAERWVDRLWTTGNGRVSIQVLQEFYVTVTQKLRPGMSRQSARADVRNLLSWRPIQSDARLLEVAWDLQDRFGLAWWDAPVVAAALRAECSFLLSEDLQDQMAFGNTTVVNPFTHEYDAVVR